MAIPKWTDERTAALTEFVGSESPVSYATVIEAADQLETSPRSVAAKLRKMEFEVESSASASSRVFSEAQENTLREFVNNNSGVYTYGQIAEAFEGGKFSPKQIQGKLLSMQLTDQVKPTPKAENQRSFSPDEEAKIVALVADGAFLEDIAEALGRTIPEVRGKSLSMLKLGDLEAIPAQRETKSASKVDPLEDVDVSGMTVEEIAEQIGRTARGVKTMLTRRGLTATNYDGAAKAAKAAG
jgi:DNA-binding CsgD family transcriptional regulator